MTADESMEEAVNQSMTTLGQEMAKPMAVRKAENSQPAHTTVQASAQVKETMDYDRLVAIGEKLLKQKTDERMHAISVYEKQRIDIVDHYRVQMERLKIEAEDELRKLEYAHSAKLETLEKLINKVRLLRET